LKNLQDAEKILAKATEVLTKFYDWLHKHNAAHSYREEAGKDSGGGNLERIEGASQAELEEACSGKPECVGFNSAGWLKSALAPKEEWYAWDGGSLYVRSSTRHARRRACSRRTRRRGATRWRASGARGTR